MSDDTPLKGADPFARWRGATSARIGLGRAGQAIPTSAMLSFNLAHARARDAVHSALDVEVLRKGVEAETCHVKSQAQTRADYLKNPGLGRQLADGTDLPDGGCEAVIILADGLSATAIQSYGAQISNALMAKMPDWAFGPVVIAEQARVAIGDAVGARMKADLAIVLIGERPGLSASDSVGAYLTWAPRPGRADSERNCISNIRPGGLDPELGAANIAWLANEARRKALTGVQLKDRFADEAALSAADRSKHLQEGKDL